MSDTSIVSQVNGFLALGIIISFLICVYRLAIILFGVLPSGVEEYNYFVGTTAVWLMVLVICSSALYKRKIASGSVSAPDAEQQFEALDDEEGAAVSVK